MFRVLADPGLTLNTQGVLRHSEGQEAEGQEGEGQEGTCVMALPIAVLLA